MQTFARLTLWKINALDDPQLWVELSALSPETDKSEIHDRFYWDLELTHSWLRLLPQPYALLSQFPLALPKSPEKGWSQRLPADNIDNTFLWYYGSTA